ncbi:ABC transporter ATP-binding protein [Aureimonas populi]|uniref:ABC transporter ATP-binding protein n=2 Tax=Aureimonas populi TaxID=1701758 RepID=A0ABW5CQ90_9HYPH
MNSDKQAAVLNIEKVRKTYGTAEALGSIDLCVAAGEFLTILGPSGSGKTTLLRIIAGFEAPDSGRVSIRGMDMTWATAAERQIGMVFQNYALFPHLTVLENVMFPLEMRAIRRGPATERARAALESVHLGAFADRYPKQLSGGQQQRVALARAIVFEPSLLLLDEPFSALDRRLRESMQQEVKQLQVSLGLTTIFITHDQDEALVMSDRIAVMSGGAIRQIGTPSEIYYHPNSISVATFVGESNIFDGTPVGCGFRAASGARFTLAAPAECTRILIRPETVSLRRPPAAADHHEKNVFSSTVIGRSFVGGFTDYRVRLAEGDEISVRAVAREGGAFELGETLQMIVAPEDCRPLSGKAGR